MLNKIQVEESDELDDLAEQIETAEALASGEPLVEESVASPEQLRAKALRAAGKSYSAIAREIFDGVQVGSFHINKVKQMLGEAGAQTTAEVVETESPEPPQKKRPYSRRKPSDDGGGQPLAQGNGHPSPIEGAATNGHGNGSLALYAPSIPLTPEQLSKLWGIVVGGSLTIAYQVDQGKIVCQVSPDSFNRALPILLDRL